MAFIKSTQSTQQLKKLLNDQSKPFEITKAIDYVEAGAEVNTQADNGNTILHRLIECEVESYFVIITLLTKYGACIHLKNKEGLEAMGYWMATGCNNPKLYLDMLRHDKGVVNARDEKGNTILHYFAERGVYDTDVEDAIKCFVWVYGADINALNDMQQTPLKVLIAHDFDARFAMQLLAFKADPNTKNEDGNSLLHLFAASKFDNTKEIKLLFIHYHIDLFAKNKLGQTPVQSAEKRKLANPENIRVLRKLINYYARPAFTFWDAGVARQPTKKEEATMDKRCKALVGIFAL